jgi:putative membrane protein
VRRALRLRGVRPAARGLTHPLIAYVVYNVVFLGWHLPIFYNAALVSHDLHIVQHLTFLAAATMMWWPVINPVPELQRLPEGLVQMAYLFAFAVPATAVSAFITMSDEVLYRFYGEAPLLFGLTPLEDQRLGGLLMWIPGMLIFWAAITAVYFRWTKDEIRSWRKAPGSAVSNAGPPP